MIKLAKGTIEFLDYLQAKAGDDLTLLNKWEMDFIDSINGKDELTEKQFDKLLEIKKKIKNKI